MINNRTNNCLDRPEESPAISCDFTAKTSSELPTVNAGSMQAETPISESDGLNKRAKKKPSQISVNPKDFLLIGDKYYRLNYVPLPGGDQKQSLSRVDRRQIKEDFPTREQRSLIPRYFGFTSIPQNIEYERNFDGYFNKYNPPIIKPVKGVWPNIGSFLNHLFGAQYKISLDYLYLLYKEPTQRLPVIVLASSERGTGKTTFLNFLACWYGENMAFPTNDTLRSRFNSEWAGKLIVGVDETLLNRCADSEKIKDLATSKRLPLEAKGSDRIEIQNYTHIVLCTNNLRDPLFIDKEENRYWVIKVPPLEREDPDLLNKLKAELPAFAWYLCHQHQLTYAKAQSRLWFPPEAYETDALRRIKNSSAPLKQSLVAEIIMNIMDELSIEEVCFTITELQQVINDRGFQISHLAKTLRAWPKELYHADDNLTYDSYVLEGKLIDKPKRKRGRYYKFVYETLKQLIENV